LIFVVTLTHPPELCLANPPYREEAKKWVANASESAKKLGVKIHSSYVATNEHTFYLVLETDSFKAVSDFLSPPMLTHHTARVSPVIAAEEAFGLSFMK
jgi:hypothetical protein